MPTSTPAILPFEGPVKDLEQQIEALQAHPDAENMADEIASLRENRNRLLEKIYGSLSAWDIVRIARHPNRPQTPDYIHMICRDFRELHGDRHFGDDRSILTGLGRIGPFKAMIIGHQKGRTTEERIECNFGCAHPEGYRKALKNMKLAEKYGLPIVTFIDTPGAYPGIKAEERGQAEAIAVNLREMSRLATPIISIVIGEGGSGGALGIGVADRVDMLQYAWYSVISPEGCAAILWKEANETTNSAAAESLCLTAEQNLANGLIDQVIPEPSGGSHRDPSAAAELLERHIVDRLSELSRFNPRSLVDRRYDRFRKIGAIAEA